MLWHSTDWLSNIIKALIAAVFLYIVITLAPRILQLLALTSPAKLESANHKLKAELSESSPIEENLGFSQQMLLLVLNNIPQHICWKDTNSVYLGCNDSAAKAVGLESPEAIIGLTDYDLPWTRENSDHYREWDTRVMNMDTPEYHIIETQLQADGRLAWLDTSKIPLHDAQGNVMGILLTVEDITVRQQAQVALKQANELLEIKIQERMTELRNLIQHLESEIARSVVQVALRQPAGVPYAVCGISTDITERKAAEERIRFQANLLSQMKEAVIAIDHEQRITYWNQGAEQLYDLTSDEVLGRALDVAYQHCWLHPKDEKAAYDSLAATGSWHGENIHIKKSGEEIHVESWVSVLKDADDANVGLLAVIRDITGRKRDLENLRLAYDELEIRVRERTAELEKANLELLTENSDRQRAELAARQSEERYRTLVEQAGDGIFITDFMGNYLDVNPRGCEMFGYSREELLRMRISSMVSSEDIPALLQALSDLQLGKPTVTQWRFKRQDGRVIPIEVSAKMLPNGHLQGIARDITERKRAEYELLHNAFHDALTGLPNRALFMESLGRVVQQAKRQDDYFFAVLFLDLDRFKVINDSLGHLLGDQFLIAIASRLEPCLRSTDTAARLGGDEFTILLEGIKDFRDAIKVAERIQQELALPVDLNGQEVFTTASIGIALSSTGYDQPDDLLRNADTAMYRAKALGKARYEIFHIDMYATAVARLQLETDLRRAIDRQEFRVYYQPIISLSNGRILGFEALIRWQHPDRGLVSPASFIPMAEETGLIVSIGYWVLRSACCQMQAWRVRFGADSPKKISVNLSFKQFSQPDLMQQIAQILDETGLDACCLELEITESVIMENGLEAVATLSQLRSLGIELSIDDFGTGYSSLGRLHSFPISALKIDRSFVSSMVTYSSNLEITETIVTLAHKLGVYVTAEGIETAEQLALLRALKCELGQGQFFSEALNSQAAEALIVAFPQW